MKLSGARIVLECIKREGVDLIFGLPGGAVLPIYDALYDFEGLRHVLVRQEAAAGHAAEGYARTTGKVGVCLVTSGPAATNLVTALQDALMDSIPIVAFTGQVPTTSIGNDAFQEADNVGITRSATKHNFLVKDGKDLAPIIKEAFHIACTGRPGPVHVDLPEGHPGQGVDLRVPRARAPALVQPDLRGPPRADQEGGPLDGAGQAAGALRGRRRDLLGRLARAAGAGGPDPDPAHPDPHGPGLVPDGRSALARHARHARHLLRQHGGAPLGLPGGGGARASTTG